MLFFQIQEGSLPWVKGAWRSHDGGLDLLRFLRRKPAPQPGTLRWGNFLTGQKVTKDPPKAGPSPALWNPPRGTECTCVLLVSALVLVGSHRWLAVLRVVLTPLIVHASIARAYPEEAAFPPPGARLPTAGNSGSPGEGPGNRSTILQRSRHHPQNVYAIYVT